MLLTMTITNIQLNDVPLDFLGSNFNIYINAGTSINPPPVPNNPHIIPAIIPNIIFFTIIV